MIQAALLGGTFIGVLSALPIVNVANCCCLWILGGGALAAHILQQNEPLPIGPVRGAGAGLLAGIVGALVWLVLAIAVDVLIAPFHERLTATMIRNAQGMPPDVRAWFETMGNPAASSLRFVVGFVFQLIAGVMFSTVGGVIAASVLRPGPTAAPPPPPSPLPPPLPPPL